MTCSFQDPLADPFKPDLDQTKERGFALVLALALLSFLFLLVLALISYIGVESQLAESHKAYALARSHARLGLVVAIGELQEHAGPDQRVTATASILDKDPETLEVDGVDQPYWTGVWKRNPAAPLFSPGQDSAEPWDVPPDPEWDAHPEIELTWLVSGNEGNQRADDFVLVHPVSTTLPDPDASSDTSDTVWLVNHAVSQPDERVKAKKSAVSLSFSAPTGSTSDEITGSYAYWVGDEGVKTKVNLPKSNRIPDAQEDFLLNQARFEVSPGPNLSLAERTDASFDLDSVDKTMLGKVVNVPQLQYALSGSEDSSASLKDYFHHLTADAYGVLSDVLLGGLKRDLTAGFGDDTHFDYYLSGKSFFKDKIRYIHDYDALNWRRNGGVRQWIPGFIDEDRWLRGPLWDYLRDYYQLYKEVNFDSGNPLETSISPRPVALNEYPNRNGEFWTRHDDSNLNIPRTDPTTHPITPLLLEVKVGHALEMIPTGNTDSNGTPLFQPRIAIFPSLALWNPYNVELEAAVYELQWKTDPKFWVYHSNRRDNWANKVMRHEKNKNIPAGNRLWDWNGDGRCAGGSSKPDPNPPWWNPDHRIGIWERNVMHSLFLGSKKGRNIPYKQSPGQGGGGTGNISQGTGLRAIPRELHRRGFHLYRYAPRDKEYEGISGWVRNGNWHPFPGRTPTKPLHLRTTPVRMAPGEKLYFTLTESGRFSPAEDNIFTLGNHLSFQHYLYYNVPRQLCPPVPADKPVTFVYTGGGIAGYWLGPFQKDAAKDEADKNPTIRGTALFMLKDGERYPIKKINHGMHGQNLNWHGSYQDYGRADIVVADPSRVVGPRLYYRLNTFHHNPRPIFVEHNPRSLVDPWHLGPGRQWWRGTLSDLDGGIGDADLDDDRGVAFNLNAANDESLSGDYYNSGSRIYYGYQGHSFDVAGFQRYSRRNDEDQWLPRTSRAVFFDIPRQPLMSLASLQHVNLGHFCTTPTYAIGNSYATTLVSRNRKWSRFNQIGQIALDPPYTKRRGGNEHQNTIIDLSYYANEKLWDGFFFSTVPTEDLATNRNYPPFEDFDQYYVDAGKPLPNPRMVYYAGLNGLSPDLEKGDGALRDFQKAAANLMVDGAFNVNSTSVEAWKAQLGSLSQSELHIRDLQDDNELASSGRKKTTLDFGTDLFPFPRMSVSMGEPVNPQSGDPDQDYWSGFAALNKDQLHRLAEEIVEQVKHRGPFLSLGDFVNRRLTNPSSSEVTRKLHKMDWPNETDLSRQGLRGTLQAAIHDALINDGGFREKYNQKSAHLDFVPSNIGQFNPFGYVAAGNYNDGTNRSISQVPHHRWTNWGLGYDRSIRRHKVRDRNDPDVVTTKVTYFPRWGEQSFGEAPVNMLAATNGVSGAMIPGWLSQADVLTSLAPVINARSDTFRVRAYGDGGPNYPDVKVWCEAIVQRLPEYVVDAWERPDEGDPPHFRPMEPYDDLNDNGERDSDEKFLDYDSNGEHSFIDDYGDKQLQNPDNERFGRRFRIVRFRWLSADEV